MSEQTKATINRLPAPTWRWLKMNGADMPVVPYQGSALQEKEIPTGITESTVPADTWSVATREQAEIARRRQELAETFEPPAVREKDLVSTGEAIYSGAGSAVDAWIEAACEQVTQFTATAGQQVGEPLRLRFAYEAGENRADAVHLAAEPGSQMTVIMDCVAAGDAAGQGVLQTKLHLAPNAEVRLVQIHREGENGVLINDVGALLEKGARLEVLHLIVSGKQTYVGCRADLAGEGSALQIDTAYLVKNEDSLDINYFANHLGGKTICEINADGVLRDRAKKIFRGTIDFKTGAAGAIGNEKEDVLLMDDTVVNQTIPLILCAEEDVVGNHGATIGRLDEQLLFYLESRGMDRDEVYEMMAQARLDAVIRKIPDARMREEFDTTERDRTENDTEETTA